MDTLVRLTNEPLDPLEVIQFARTPRAGALVYFGGSTRDNFGGKQVTHLAYEAYEAMATKTMQRIADQALAKWAAPGPDYVCKVAILHRLGSVPIGEDSVIIAASAGHREAGFAAARWILEQVKMSAEIWKNELYEDGSGVWKANDGGDVEVAKQASSGA